MPDNSSNKIIGVVLCGGKSTRMGSDKGLLFVDGQRWFERGFHLLRKVFPKVVISVHSNQHLVYKEIQPNWEYIIDSIDFAEGPLVGIFSIHEKYPNSDLFVLACDMIEMNLTPIQGLISIYRENIGNDFYLYQNETYIEALCGIYTSKGIQKIKKRLIENKDKNFSIHKLILDCNSLTILVSIEFKRYFTNFNTPRDKIKQN